MERHKINSTDLMTEETIWKTQKPVEVASLQNYKNEHMRMHMQKQILELVRQDGSKDKGNRSFDAPPDFASFFNVGYREAENDAAKKSVKFE